MHTLPASVDPDPRQLLRRRCSGAECRSFCTRSRCLRRLPSEKLSPGYDACMVNSQILSTRQTPTCHLLPWCTRSQRVDGGLVTRLSAPCMVGPQSGQHIAVPLQTEPHLQQPAYGGSDAVKRRGLLRPPSLALRPVGHTCCLMRAGPRAMHKIPTSFCTCQGAPADNWKTSSDTTTVYSLIWDGVQGSHSITAAYLVTTSAIHIHTFLVNPQGHLTASFKRQELQRHGMPVLT
jgi:hypothetical protein